MSRCRFPTRIGSVPTRRAQQVKERADMDEGVDRMRDTTLRRAIVFPERVGTGLERMARRLLKTELMGKSNCGSTPREALRVEKQNAATGF